MLVPSLGCILLKISAIPFDVDRIDRNPQTFCNIFTCDEDAFQVATQRVHKGSCLEVLVM